EPLEALAEDRVVVGQEDRDGAGPHALDDRRPIGELRLHAHLGIPPEELEKSSPRTSAGRAETVTSMRVPLPGRDVRESLAPSARPGAALEVVGEPAERAAESERIEGRRAERPREGADVGEDRLEALEDGLERDVGVRSRQPLDLELGRPDALRGAVVKLAREA